MRIVSCNANYNGRRCSFDAALEMVESLRPDIAVLCETAPPSVPDGPQVSYIGAAASGVAVVAFGEYELDPHRSMTARRPSQPASRCRARRCCTFSPPGRFSAGEAPPITRCSWTRLIGTRSS